MLRPGISIIEITPYQFERVRGAFVFTAMNALVSEHNTPARPAAGRQAGGQGGRLAGRHSWRAGDAVAAALLCGYALANRLSSVPGSSAQAARP